MRFDLFGIDVLSVAQDDDFFLATGEKEVTLRVEISEVAGQEPSIAHDCGRCVGAVPVALHHHRAAHRDFANWRTAILLRLRIDDLTLDTFHRLAAGADYVVMRRSYEDGCGRFRQAQGLQYVDAEIVKVPHDLGIEARATGGEVAHFRPEGVVDFAEEDTVRH